MKNFVVDGNTEIGRKYPIQPKDIDAGELLYEAYSDEAGKLVYKSFSEARDGACAVNVIRICQERGGWIPLLPKEIGKLSSFYETRYSSCDGVGDYCYLCIGEDGFFRVTHAFISRCFVASPAI